MINDLRQVRREMRIHVARLPGFRNVLHKFDIFARLLGMPRMAR